MYSVFVQALLYSIANQLGLYATHEVMEAWVNVFSFIMKSMLPPAINGQTLETEICINTKTEFSSDNMKAQVQEIKYEREKGLSSYRSQPTNRTPNNASRMITPSSNKNGEFPVASEACRGKPRSSIDIARRTISTEDDENGFDKSNSSSNSFRVFLPKLPLVISDKNDDDL